MIAMSENKIHPTRIGVGVIVNREGKTLLGKRKGNHGGETWACCGGHLEWGESLEECARRELAEETGLKAVNLRLGPMISNMIEEKHYITFYMIVDSYEGEVALLEPHKCEGWEWFDWHSLPSPLFVPLQGVIDSLGREMLQQGQSLSSLLEKWLQFVRERKWERYHSPKNLVMDLATEMGELVEPFRWLTEEESYQLDAATKKAVADEIADVFKTLLYLSHQLGIDPIAASHEKLNGLGKKYPIPSNDKLVD